MREFILHSRWYEIMLAGLAFFAGLYLLLGTINTLLTRHLLPAIGYGGVLDPRPLLPGQIRRELLQSACSIFLFGTGVIFPWGLLQWGWAGIALDPPWWQTTLEIIVLIAWNEVHFYANHWLLHTRWLRRFHTPHHRSVVVTPWATYSFHPVEAILLGNVIMLPMVVHDFSVGALLALPVFSLLFNNIGHSNYDFLPDAHADRWWLNGARRHHLHHACFRGNFGFMFPFMDRLFGTALPPDAAHKQLDGWRARHTDHAA
ncbi:Fatty acid hydroxylase superfamily protein [Andreprevotia lacus DSM 23236]|jgi:sterol desaturase/sphingolipid hydroxylase (fatty acid hydroxylase superfamily)|uniref:Fatty acid hydroxylase superfamily protein n=1 Tax=Andreprevotia lacus DSM 23236 TaxID=1121001 RepID=A0A1W1XUA8_9NEIS|nr:sterol desaturase family protein [Andreprevotia lacus]SMC27088.1 Fatty acid hydroxylase superfamily protein [Andreprevotia lacus DSM 23236]